MTRRRPHFVLFVLAVGTLAAALAAGDFAVALACAWVVWWTLGVS